MKYDLSNPLHRQQLRTRFEMLFKKEQGVVELTVCKPQTTTPQNRYTRVICAYFGCITDIGDLKEEAKDQVELPKDWELLDMEVEWL